MFFTINIVSLLEGFSLNNPSHIQKIVKVNIRCIPQSYSYMFFSRMRSEGFLFSFLGVWGWWTVCGSFSRFNSLIASSPCLWESEKR